MRLRDFAPRQLNELSPATLASYKKKAGAAATAADAAGDTKTGNKRFSGIVKATKKQFDQDAKGVSEGLDNTVRFEVDSENAYNHVMDQFDSVIDWDGDTMVAPRKYWGAIQELALAAGGEASEEQGLAEATGDEKFDKSMRQMTGKITPDDAAEMFPTQEFEPLDLDPSYLPMMDKYKAKLFPLAYEFWTEGTNADELRALGWEPDYGDDYVMVVLSGIGHDGHIQYDKYDFDAEGEDENITEDSLAGMKRLAGIASAQTQSTPGQRQYRHMPTAVQPR